MLMWKMRALKLCNVHTMKECEAIKIIFSKFSYCGNCREQKPLSAIMILIFSYALMTCIYLMRLYQVFLNLVHLYFETMLKSTLRQIKDEYLFCRVCKEHIFQYVYFSMKTVLTSHFGFNNKNLSLLTGNCMHRCT